VYTRVFIYFVSTTPSEAAATAAAESMDDGLGNEDDDEWSIGVRQLVGNYNDILYYISVRI
jgi:hypothetical protein